MKVKALVWPAMILGMLAANVAIVAVTMVAAHKGGGASVSPAYDERALRWDDYRHQLAQSNALGWNCLVRLERPAREAQTGTLQLTLTSRDDQPVEATKLRVQLFHSGHPTEQSAVEMVTDIAGKCIMQVPAARPGYYTLHIESPATSDRAAYVYDVEILAQDSGAMGGGKQP